MSLNMLKIELNRAVWVALLKQNEILKAIEQFQTYIVNLKESAKDPQIAVEVLKEIQTSNDILIKKLTSLAQGYIEKKDYANAVLCLKEVFERDPEDTKNLEKYIKCLDELEQYDIALKLCKILIIQDDKPDNYKQLSKLYEKGEDFPNAVTYYKKYVARSNKNKMDANDYNTIGCLYFNAYIKKSKDPEDAKRALKYIFEALKLEPKSKMFLKNGLCAAMKAKDYKIERLLWDIYIKEGYLSVEDEFTYCASCLRNGDIAEYGKYYGSRFRKTDPTYYPKMTKPEWKGEDISDKILLVHYEQGYGDNFLMWGYVPRLTKLCKKVIYYIQNNAYDLIKDNDFGVEVQCFNTKKLNEIEFDYHIPSMSVPIVLKLDKAGLCVGGGYIKANKEKAEEYKKQYFNNDKYKIGLSFAGVEGNQKRDIPLESLKRLDCLENVEFYCLNKDIPDKRLKCFKNNKLVNIGKKFATFADTAAAIENLDILVSSDNGILNLAGAMGKKTLGIFNYHYEFRWYDLSGDDVGYYKSVKPIINDPYDNWDKSIDKAIEYIKKDMDKKKEDA